MQTILLLIFLLGFSGNSNQTIIPGNQGKYFEDINIFSLKGINELKRIQFPCVELLKFEDSVIVTFHIAKNSKEQITFKKSTEGWVSKYVSKGGKGDVITYEYLLKNKLLQFNYHADGNTLIDANEVNENSEIKYFPKPGFKIEPSVKNFKEAKAKAEFIYECKMAFNGSILVIRDKRVSRTGEVRFSNKLCYKAGKRSYLWWAYFGGSYLNQIKCP